MACDLWLVPLVDVLCHSPDNPFAEEIASYDKALGEAGLPSVPVFAYMPGLSGDVAPVAASTTTPCTSCGGRTCSRSAGCR